MKLSIIILTWNSITYIENCINSIVQHTGSASSPYEIFVVDNGSSDGTVAVLKELESKFHQLIKLILLTRNTGTTYSRNLALKRAKGEFIAIVDSDVMLTSNIFDKLILFLQENEHVGLVAPRLTYGNNCLQKTTDNFPTFFNKLYRYFFLKKIEFAEFKNIHSQMPQEVDYAISAFWVFPSKILVKVGILDEQFFYAPEDVDYCLRVWKSGLKVIYYPLVTAIHDAQEISRKYKMNKAFYEHIKGLIYLFFKHKYFVTPPRVKR